jgi:hypothetical protein
MMVPLVPAFTTVGFRQFNPAIFNAIDGSDVHAIRADNLHMLFYRVSGIQVSSPVVGRADRLRGYSSQMTSRAKSRFICAASCDLQISM